MSNIVRIGVLRLTDSAPVILARERGIFAALGVDAQISIEPSWSNIADKLAHGVMDAAVMLPPLALAASIGLRGPAAPVIVPMGLTRGGNSIVVRSAIAAAVGVHQIAAWLRAEPAPPRVAVVHRYSTHNLLLRYWLARAGIDPDRDVDIVIMPPADVVPAMAQGRISLFCAGAPWGDHAIRLGVGRLLTGTSAIWPAHPEKCLAVNADWAAARPDALYRLTRALLRAQQLCDQVGQADGIAATLTDPAGLALPAVTRMALPGGAGGEHIRFFANDAWYPARAHALWFLGQMRRWGWLADDLDLEQTAQRVYRPDLLTRSAEAEGLFATRNTEALESVALPGMLVDAPIEPSWSG